MKKGRFGLVLCFYPIAAFVGVILKLPLLCCGLLALAVFAERDEWVSRQTLQAALLTAPVLLFDIIVPWVSWSCSQFTFIPRLASVMTFIFTLLSFLVYIAAVVFSILGILRVMKEREADIPLCAELAYKAFGQRKPKPAPAWQQQYPPQGYQQPIQPGQPVPPVSQPEQKQP